MKKTSQPVQLSTKSIMKLRENLEIIHPVCTAKFCTFWLPHTVFHNKKKSTAPALGRMSNIIVFKEVQGGNSQPVSDGLILSCRVCALPWGLQTLTGQMQRLPSNWDMANLWLFNEVPVADMLLSGQAVAIHLPTAKRRYRKRGP